MTTISLSTITGTAGPDVLRGTRGADEIVGLGGGDLLAGGPGTDFLYGGEGADTLVGGTEDAILDGGPGSDTARFDGTRGADRWLVGTGIAFDDPGLYVFDDSGQGFAGVPLSGIERLEFNGGAGADRLVVEEVFGTRLVPVLSTTVEVVGIESLTFNGGGGNDTLDGSAANGPLLGRGGAGDDRLVGGSGADTLLGGAGRDVLLGGAGDDTLDGGAGGDVLVGGLGADVLTGGAGADVFRFMGEDDLVASVGRSGPDRITDFSLAQGDRIDLRGIAADVTVPGDQGFLFADGLVFVRYQPGTVTTEIDRDAGVTTVSLDTGTGANAVLVVQGRIEFTAGDFIV